VAYDSSNSTNIGNGYFSPGNESSSYSVTSGRQYYVRVRLPYSSNESGTYRITFNTSANTWAEWNSSLGEVKWFRFTATAATQYVHVEYGALTYPYVQIYNNNGILVNSTNFNIDGIRSYTYTLTSGQQYYIKVWQNTGSGVIKILFSASAVAPGVTVNTLTTNTWANFNAGDQWFNFTANANTQYIHIQSNIPGSTYIYGYGIFVTVLVVVRIRSRSMLPVLHRLDMKRIVNPLNLKQDFHFLCLYEKKMALFGMLKQLT